MADYPTEEPIHFVVPRTKDEHVKWQYALRERFLLGLERAQEAFAAGNAEAARKYVDVALDIDHYETEYVIDLFTPEITEEIAAFGVVDA